MYRSISHFRWAEYTQTVSLGIDKDQMKVGRLSNYPLRVRNVSLKVVYVWNWNVNYLIGNKSICNDWISRRNLHDSFEHKGCHKIVKCFEHNEITFCVWVFSVIIHYPNFKANTSLPHRKRLSVIYRKNKESQTKRVKRS